MFCERCGTKILDNGQFCIECGVKIDSDEIKKTLKVEKKKNPWLGAILVFIFGAFGFLYYSWKKAIVVFLLFFLPNIFLYSYDDAIAEIIRWLIQLALSYYAYLDIQGKTDTIENIFSNILKVTIYPIIFLNFFGIIAGAIWLLFLRQWGLVVSGILIDIIAPFIFSIVLLIEIPLAGLVTYAYTKNKKIFALVIGFISMLITHFVILFYTFYIFGYAVSSAEKLSINIFPFLLFGYGIATGPLSYMASKEGPDALASILGVYISQISYIILAILYLFNYLQLAIPITLMITFGIEIYLLNITSRVWGVENYSQKEIKNI